MLAVCLQLASLEVLGWGNDRVTVTLARKNAFLKPSPCQAPEIVNRKYSGV